MSKHYKDLKITGELLQCVAESLIQFYEEGSMDGFKRFAATCNNRYAECPIIFSVSPFGGPFDRLSLDKQTGELSLVMEFALSGVEIIDGVNALCDTSHSVSIPLGRIELEVDDEA